MKTYFLQLPYLNERNGAPMCVTILASDAERLVKARTHKMYEDTVGVIYVVSPIVAPALNVEYQLGEARV